MNSRPNAVSNVQMVEPKGYLLCNAEGKRREMTYVFLIKKSKSLLESCGLRFCRDFPNPIIFVGNKLS